MWYEKLLLSTCVRGTLRIITKVIITEEKVGRKNWVGIDFLYSKATVVIVVTTDDDDVDALYGNAAKIN
jgi:hypothetical protein